MLLLTTGLQRFLQLLVFGIFLLFKNKPNAWNATQKKKQGKLHCAKYREESLNLSSSNEGPVRSISRISWYACLTWSITKTNYDLLISFEINTSSLCFYFLFLCHFISFVFQGKVSVSARSLLVSGFVKAI